MKYKEIQECRKWVLEWWERIPEKFEEQWSKICEEFRWELLLTLKNSSNPRTMKKIRWVKQMFDVDWTLISKSQIWSQSPRLRSKTTHWVYEELQNLFSATVLPRVLLDKIDTRFDYILTAWNIWVQTQKIRNLSHKNVPLWEIRRIIVPNSADKIKRFIDEAVYDTWVIADQLIIYEDTTEYFVEYQDLIEFMLWTRLRILKVIMNDDNSYKSIEQVWR